MKHFNADKKIWSFWELWSSTSSFFFFPILIESCNSSCYPFHLLSLPRSSSFSRKCSHTPVMPSLPTMPFYLSMPSLPIMLSLSLSGSLFIIPYHTIPYHTISYQPYPGITQRVRSISPCLAARAGTRSATQSHMRGGQQKRKRQIQGMSLR